MKMLKLFLTVSLLTTASCASNGSPFEIAKTALRGESSTLTAAEQREIRQVIRETYPEFPYPSAAAIQAIRNLNDPALNSWVQDLTILCRQLDEECNHAAR